MHPVPDSFFMLRRGRLFPKDRHEQNPRDHIQAAIRLPPLGLASHVTHPMFGQISWITPEIRIFKDGLVPPGSRESVKGNLSGHRRTT